MEYCGKGGLGCVPLGKVVLVLVEYRILSCMS